MQRPSNLGGGRRVGPNISTHKEEENAEDGTAAKAHTEDLGPADGLTAVATATTVRDNVRGEEGEEEEEENFDHLF